MQTVGLLSSPSDRITHAHNGGIISIRATSRRSIRVRIIVGGTAKEWDGRQELEPCTVEVRKRDSWPDASEVFAGVYSI